MTEAERDEAINDRLRRILRAQRRAARDYGIVQLLTAAAIIGFLIHLTN